MERYLVKPGSKVHLNEWDPEDKELCQEGKEAALLKLEQVKDRLRHLQVAFFAEHSRRLLVILQGMDTSGKDSTIRNVFGSIDPQGIRVTSFGKPSPLELSHDYLWRIHQHVPPKGFIGIFNRSHYEDVLAVRVHNLKPQSVWSKRFEHINAFEKMLVDEDTIVLKFFLHIDFEEQRNRLLSRKEKPHKQWKLIPQDISDRKLWPEYTAAYEDVLSKTSTPWAPWYIIPSNRKWYRNLLIAEIVTQTLQEANPSFPQPPSDLSSMEI